MNEIKTRRANAVRSTPSYNPYKPQPTRPVFRGTDPVDSEQLYKLRLAFVSLQSVIIDRHASEAHDITWPMSPANANRLDEIVGKASELADLCDAVRLEEERYLKRDA